MQYCQRVQVSTILCENSDRFARDLVVQETGLQWLKEMNLEVLPIDMAGQFVENTATAKMVRQMLGAINEYVGAQIRDRLGHGFKRALEVVSQDPKGKRSYTGQPKLGGPPALLELDSKLKRRMQAFARMSRRPSLTAIAERLRQESPAWCVQTGPNKGHAWSAKQVRCFLQKHLPAGRSGPRLGAGARSDVSPRSL